ncbi:DNA repair protein rad8 [Colletotrichum incanum]|nr:DNA repair protein rad8 [Colletotrichum incanum]
MPDQGELEDLNRLNIDDIFSAEGLEGDEPSHEEAVFDVDRADDQRLNQQLLMPDQQNPSFETAYRIADSDLWHPGHDASRLDRVDDEKRSNNLPVAHIASLPTQYRHRGSELSYSAININQVDFAQGMAPEADLSTPHSQYQMTPQDLANHPANAGQAGLSHTIAPMALMGDEFHVFPSQQQGQSYGSSPSTVTGFIESTNNSQLQPANGLFSIAHGQASPGYTNQQSWDAQPGGMNSFQDNQGFHLPDYVGVDLNNTQSDGLQYDHMNQQLSSQLLHPGYAFTSVRSAAPQNQSSDGNYHHNGQGYFNTPPVDAIYQPQNPQLNNLPPHVSQQGDFQSKHTSALLQIQNGQDPIIARYRTDRSRAIAAEDKRVANIQSLLGVHGQPGEDINMLGIFPTPEKLLEVVIDACLVENVQLPAPGSLLRQADRQANRQKDLDERAVLKPRDSFEIIFNRACKLGFEHVAEDGGVSFKIATMCSGTDGPILALREFTEAATGHGYSNALQHNHVFSVEIDPFKQAFIDRNARPSGPIFRNVIDVGRPGAVQAMTASGAMADIPTKIDILIAGSSCVDFSSLNIQRENKKRASGLQKLFDQFKERGITDVLGQDDPIAEEAIEGLKALFENIDEEKGESTRTFLSILLYVFQHRPKILILENVTKAPWDQFKGFWLPAIGYTASVVQVDSKNFLVPQTRQRKYLVAVDGRRYGDGASEIVNGWAKLMDSSQWFKNPPDLQRFLLPPSDPRVLQARFQLERALLSKPKKDVDAVVCQNDHRLARRNEGLGDSHPYTRLDDRGNVQPREESWRGYIFVITTRMQDLLDITCLRCYMKGFDFMYKVLVLDLGQNVDRQGARLGVMPCVLPSCDPYLSYYGRPVLGLECLAVQGIPIDRISISVEKEAQLKDLAGNAMTATVAGAAILSPTTDAAKMDWQDAVIDTLEGELIVGFLTDLCRKGRRNCLCDAFRRHQHTGTYWRCNDCNEIRCESCTGNPDHNFDKLHPIDATRSIDKNVAFQLATVAFPAHLFIDAFNPNADVLDGLSGQAFGQHRAALQLAIKTCCGSKHYYQTSLKFRDDITVTYESTDSYITLVVTEKDLTWNLHVRPCHFNVADISMEPDESIQNAALLLNSLEYDIRKPLLRALYVQQRIGIQVGQEPVRFSPGPGLSEGFRQQLLDVPDYPQLMDQVAEDIDGEFYFTELCGTPFGLLYTRKDDDRSRIYHMLHTNSTTTADGDRWVLTNNPRKLEPDESRDIICMFSEDFTHFMDDKLQQEPRQVTGTLPGVWKSLQTDYRLTISVRGPALTVRFSNLAEQSVGLDNCLSSLPSILVRLENTDMHYPVKSLLVKWDVSLNAAHNSSEPWVSVASHEAKDALALFSSAMNKIKRTSEDSEQIRSLNVRNILLDVNNPCQICSPEPAKILHRWDENGNIERIEDEQMAARTDRDLQRRPDPYEIQAWIDPNIGGTSRLSILNFRILFRPMSLAHRAHGHFPKNKDLMSTFVRSAQGSGTFEVQFEFWDPSLKELRPFKQSMVPVKEGDFPLDNTRQPPNFARNGMALRRDQWEAVQWMLKREHSNDSFIEKEFEECVLPSVNVRLHATASMENLARGGVLAHDIGYGKTIVTLGLVDFSTANPEHEGKSIRERTLWLGNTSLIHLKATLIIVPPHIVSQWAKETVRFVGHDPRGHGNGSLIVHVITRPADVVRERLVAADIIIVSSTFICSDKVMEKLAAVSKLPPVHHKKSNFKGRDHKDWYFEVVETIRQSGFNFSNPDSMSSVQLDTVLQSRRDFTNDWIQKAADNSVGPSDRKTQKTARTAAKNKGSASKYNAKATAAAAIDVLEVFKKAELLEMYTFQRAVFDEFSYENTPVAAFLQNAIASAKWILSGTPPTVDLGRICEIGTLLNVHVARATPSMPAYFPNVTAGPRISEQTDAEKYHSYTEPLSAQLAVERHEQAQRFIAHHFRKNNTDVDNVNIEEYLCFAPMQPQETFVYQLVQQLLYDAKFDIQDMTCHLALLVQAVLTKEKTAGAGLKVKASGKSLWSDAIDVLLLLASVSASYSHSGLRALKWIDADEELTFRKLSRRAARATALYLDHCSQVLASYFDQMVYLANVIEKDDTPRSATWKAKQEAYMGHMRDIINIFKHDKEDVIGDRQCIFYLKNAIVDKASRKGAPYQPPLGHDLWDIQKWSKRNGGPADFGPANWWLLEEGDDLPDEELQDLMDHWIDPTIDGHVNSNDDIIRIIRAKQLDPREPLQQAMALGLGLKKNDVTDNALTRLNKHLIGSLAKDDFEFGIQLPRHRPHKGRMIRPRGQPIDETLNCFMLVIQSIQAGIKATVEVWRHQTFALKADCLQNKQFDAHDSLPLRCSECREVIQGIQHGLQSIACGHTLCDDCHRDFQESGVRVCPVGGCQALSQGSFMPWDTFLTKSIHDMDADLATVPGSKVLQIENIILEEVKDDEKVLVFAAFAGIKSEVYTQLLGRVGDCVGVYKTDGRDQDSQIIDSFKNHPGKAVLVQSLMSSESAGTNLTEANHVIFAGVLFTDSDNYTMYMNQAKGRVIRQGQTRKVTIYHFVSPGTLEFDIFNQRQGGRIRDWGHPHGRIRLPIPDDARVDPAYPLRYRPYLEGSAVEKLLRSVEFEEFEG